MTIEEKLKTLRRDLGVATLGMGGGEHTDEDRLDWLCSFGSKQEALAEDLRAQLAAAQQRISALEQALNTALQSLQEQEDETERLEQALAHKNFEIRNLRANEESALRLAKALQNPQEPPNKEDV